MAGIKFLSDRDVVITTNDSRLRIFNLDECLQKVKFKGLKAESLQMRPSISSNGQQVCTGSEDGNVFQWDIGKIGSNHYRDPKQKAYEFFNPYLVSKQDHETHLKSLSSQPQNQPEIHSENSDSEDAELDSNKFGLSNQNRQNVCNLCMYVPKKTLNKLKN